jgi:hypothetical protein
MKSCFRSEQLATQELQVQKRALEPELRRRKVLSMYQYREGAGGDSVVEALCYKSEGPGIDFQWCHWNFLLT